MVCIFVCVPWISGDNDSIWSVLLLFQGVDIHCYSSISPGSAPLPTAAHAHIHLPENLATSLFVKTLFVTGVFIDASKIEFGLYFDTMHILHAPVSAADADAAAPNKI